MKIKVTHGSPCRHHSNASCCLRIWTLKYIVSFIMLLNGLFRLLYNSLARPFSWYKCYPFIYTFFCWIIFLSAFQSVITLDSIIILQTSIRLPPYGILYIYNQHVVVSKMFLREWIWNLIQIYSLNLSTEKFYIHFSFGMNLRYSVHYILYK